MRVTVATVAAGRELHLRRQAAAVAALRPAPAEYLLVSLDAERPALDGARVVHTPAGDGPLPVGEARNRAIAEAAGDLVVLLDADCLPAVDLLSPARRAFSRRPEALLTWPVGRLGALGERTLRPSRPALARAREAARVSGRPVVPLGTVAPEPDPGTHFWSLAFAVSPAVHDRIGGFDPGYAGYGAEDTDYALRAQEAGVPVLWVGGAWAYHQHHPVSSPPVEHLDDIVRNASRFHARWGRWPMEGWLSAFAERGLVEWTADALRRT